MTNRKFYNTVVRVEVISEDQLSDDTLLDLAKLHYAITDGDCSGKVRVESVTELDGKQAAAALEDQASDPGFFGLDPDGNDNSDDAE